MGWLREAWAQAGFGTLEALAKALHKHESWPPGIKSPRTIKNHLGDLAKQRGHTWWEQKEGRLDAMAALIAWEPERLKNEIARERRERERPTTEGQTAALAGLGRVRHLDLAVDDLPPGVPELVTRPSRWGRHWWACTDLRALELVGRWLEARGKAVFVIAQSVDELCRKLPTEGRVYALLTRAARSDDFEALADRVELDDLSVCVAAPFSWHPPVANKRASKEPDNAPTRWTAIESIMLSTILSEVVAWVDSRIQARRRVLDMKRLEFLGDDVDRICAGPCDLVDLLSFVATYVSAKKSTSRSKVLQEYLVRRGELARIRERVGGWLAKDAAATLSVMLNAALIRGVDTWSSGLTWREWAGLAPARGTNQDDVERVRRRLQGDEATASAEAREELERLLRPAEEQVVDKLVDAELLTQTEPGCFEISPCWLGQLVYQEVYAGLLARGRGSELGALLLQPSRSEAVLDDMLRRLLAHRSKRLIVSLDETEREPSTPESLAFHEALFRVLGIAALVVDDLSVSLVERVVRLQEKSLVPGPGGVPVPSVSLEANDGGKGLGTDHVFHLAAMSLVRIVPESTLSDQITTKLLHSASKSLGCGSFLSTNL